MEKKHAVYFWTTYLGVDIWWTEKNNTPIPEKIFYRKVEIGGWYGIDVLQSAKAGVSIKKMVELYEELDIPLLIGEWKPEQLLEWVEHSYSIGINPLPFLRERGIPVYYFNQWEEPTDDILISVRGIGEERHNIFLYDEALL